MMFFFFNDTATTEIYTLSLHDALPIYRETAPRAGTAVFLSGVPREPGGQRAPRLPSREPLRSAECQPVRRGKRGAEHLRRAPLQDVSRLVAHLLGDGCERGALHLAQLDAQQLQKVAGGGGGGGG